MSLFFIHLVAFFLILHPQPKLIVIMKGKKAAVYSVKYIPILIAASMVINVLLLLIGVETNFAENLTAFQTVPAMMFLLVSHALGFCWLHKGFIIYDLYVTICMDFQRECMLLHSLTEHRVMALAFGLVLFALLIYKRHSFFRISCRLYDESNDN